MALVTEPTSALPTVRPGGPPGRRPTGAPRGAPHRLPLLRAALCLQFQKEGSKVGRTGHRSRVGRATAVSAGACGGAGVGGARTGGLWAAAAAVTAIQHPGLGQGRLESLKLLLEQQDLLVLCREARA